MRFVKSDLRELSPCNSVSSGESADRVIENPVTIHFHICENANCGPERSHDMRACKFWPGKKPFEASFEHPISCDSSKVTCEECLAIIHDRVREVLLDDAESLP